MINFKPISDHVDVFLLHEWSNTSILWGHRTVEINLKNVRLFFWTNFREQQLNFSLDRYALPSPIKSDINYKYMIDIFNTVARVWLFVIEFIKTIVQSFITLTYALSPCSLLVFSRHIQFASWNWWPLQLEHTSLNQFAMQLFSKQRNWLKHLAFLIAMLYCEIGYFWIMCTTYPGSHKWRYIVPMNIYFRTCVR